MDAIDALKQKVLTLAIQGKLVPQNLSDEPASVLLEKIKAEKEALVKAGKIKKDKQESYIYKGSDNNYYEKIGSETKDITEEIPFEIPENWEWARINTICQINPRNAVNDDVEASFIPMNMIQDGFRNKHTFIVKKWKEIKSGFTHFMNNDIGIAKITPCFENRKSVIFTNLTNNVGSGTTELHILRPYSEILSKYILLLCKTEYFISNGVKNFTGTAGQQRINSQFVKGFLCPLPPLLEQERIVSEIEKIFAEIEVVKANQDELSKLREGLKNKILDLAIQGKLVEQDPNDEPASVLLEKIKAEKAELVKQGKIKKDKQESYIFKGADNRHYEKIGLETKDITEEIPFEIPNSWQWARLGSVVNYGETKAVTYPECDKNLWILDLEDIEKDSSKILYKNRIKDKPFKSIKKTFQKGDVLYSKLRPYLNKVVVADENGVCTSEILPLRAYYGIEATYLQYCLKSYYFYQYVNQLTYGVKMPRLGTEDGKKGLIPIPPLKEQQKIIQKLSKIQEIIEVP